MATSLLQQDISERLLKQYNDPSNKFEGKQESFGIKLYQYPNDLGALDLQHYIEFNINVRGKSEYDKGKRLFAVKGNPNAATLTEEEIASVGIGSTAAATGLIVGGLTQRIFARAGKTGAVSFGGAVLVGGAAALIAGKTIEASKILKPDVSYRISDVIALYVDGPPTVKYSMNYSNKELGTLAGIISGSAFDSQGALSGLLESATALGTSLAKLPSAFGPVDIQASLSAMSKTSLNPFKEVIFESVDFRTFNFKYKFFPKSKQESDQVNSIIKLFKFHMHPELTAGKLFFIYPSEFEITYYFKKDKNLYFHKLAPCALQSMEVSYGGEQFSSFNDGTPTEVNVTLSFQELEILTKEMIEKGY